MTDKQAIDVTKCIHFDKSYIPNGCTCYWDGECNHDCYYKQLNRKEKACKEWKEEYRAKVEELNELEEKLLHKEQECEELKEDRERWKSNFNGKVSAIEELLQQLDQIKRDNDLFRTCHDNEQEKRRKYEQTFAEIIRFFEEDEKFARYSGRPIIFVKPTLKKIEKILEENDIKIS